ncbi:MAG TPA: hypothetical protein VHR45_21735 [Thermoanaerobaculia bacterium]|nr:hypothetical protein [Thermoanaerobaculia bacterium]
MSWRQFRSKAAVYWLLRVSARSLMRPGVPLAEQVEDIYRRQPCSRPPRKGSGLNRTAFEVERLCYDFVNAGWGRGKGGESAQGPRQLLSGEAAAVLPQKSLILLHAGMGMALAEQTLRRLGPSSPAAAYEAALRRFLSLVELNSRPAYALVPVEALGMMVRLFRSRIRGAVERQLRAVDLGLAAYYWHGAGRAIYFLPAQFHPFPRSLDRGLEICRREPPEPAHRLDALSGFCFAAAMMGLGHPWTLEPLLARLGERTEEAEALASGIAACIVTRHHTTPDDPVIGAFLRYRPPAAEARRAELWRRWVAEPCALVLERLYVRLEAEGRLGALARHQSLAALAEMATHAPAEPPAAPGVPERAKRRRAAGHTSRRAASGPSRSSA